MPRNDKVAIVTWASTGIGKGAASSWVPRVRHQPARRRKCQRRDRDYHLRCDGRRLSEEGRRKVPDTTGRIDVLVNNAGIGLVGGAEESSIEQAQALFDVNLFGVMRATNAVLPTMRNQKAAEDHQYKFGPWPDTCPVLGPLFVYEACPRRLFGVPRSRGAELRHSSLLARARVHSHVLRAEHRASRSDTGRIRLGASRGKRTYARCDEDG